MFDSVFLELSAILLLAVAVGAIGLLLRQPLIVSFLAAGILAGQSGFGLVQAEEQIQVLAEFGIALLLFVVGLKLDLALIRSIGRVAVVTGLGQVVFTALVGFGLCLGLGLDLLPSVYVAVALTFSSTIIIVKLLSDKGEIDALHGRIALGVLIVQDIVVVLVMIGLSSLTLDAGGGAVAMAWTVLGVLAKGAAFLIGLALFMRYLAEPILRRLAGAPELLVLFAVTWAVALASLSGLLDFSKEMGAFLAGVSLASTPYREAIAARLVSLRDFLLLFFFIHLGSAMDLGTIGAQVGNAVWLSLFVLIGNPLIVLVLMGVMGYRKRTGFLTGLTVAQISEFSLIFAALGLSLGHLTREHVGLITLVGLITIGLSTYMIIYSRRLYQLCEPLLGIFERRRPVREMALKEADAAPREVDAIVVGLGRFGSNIARALRQEGRRVLGVDFDPEAVRQWRRQGHAAWYGDVTDPEFLKELPLKPDQWVIGAFRVHMVGAAGVNPVLSLVRGLRAHGYRGRVAVTAQRADEVEGYRAAGADVVLLPFADAAHHALDRLAHPERGPEAEPDPDRASAEAARSAAG